MNFKECLNRLDEISTALSDGNCELEQAMDLYLEGVKIIKECTNKLNEAKEKLDADF